MQMARILETSRAILPDWPGWALKVLLVMTGLLITTLCLLSLVSGDEKNSSKQEDQKKHGQKHLEFDKFRKHYLAVYLVIMLADWM